MNVEELIKKYQLKFAVQNGVEGMLIHNKPTQKQIAELKARKPEIMVELKHMAKIEEEKKAERKRQREKKEAKEKEENEKELAELRLDKKKIVLHYHDGEYLMGYTVWGQTAVLLEELGIAEYVDGWGYYVKETTVDTLGEEFLYSEVVAYITPIKEAREKKKAEKEAKEEAERQTKFREAKTTGKPVILCQWSEPCNDPGEECDVDMCYEMALPDGTIEIKRHHTW